MKLALAGVLVLVLGLGVGDGAQDSRVAYSGHISASRGQWADSSDVGLRLWRVQADRGEALADAPVLPDVQGATALEAADKPSSKVEQQATVDRGYDPTIEIGQAPSVGRAGVEGIICDRFEDCDYWIAVAFCESSLRPHVVGYAGQYVGLFQVWLGHGYAYDWLLDPFNNTLAAWDLSREGTVTSPWPYCQ